MSLIDFFYSKVELNFCTSFTFCGFRFKFKHKVPEDREAFLHSEKEFAALDEKKYPEYAVKYYYYRLGRKMDIAHPVRFTEKLQWLKLYHRLAEKTRLADKYRVREWVSQSIGEQYLIPLLGHWKSFDEINFELLPEKFVLKANHGSGMNLIVRDKAKLDKAEAKNKFDKWLSTNFAFVSGFELQYKDISPCILAEQFLDIDHNAVEYTVYCFNGEPKFILLEVERHSENSERAVYDINWKKLPFSIQIPASERKFPRPACFDEMIKLSRKMCKDFVFVRVDFYVIKERLYFGEMTFTPGSGFNIFVPDRYDYICGKMLNLPDEASRPNSQKTGEVIKKK